MTWFRVDVISHVAVAASRRESSADVHEVGARSVAASLSLSHHSRQSHGIFHKMHIILDVTARLQLRLTPHRRQSLEHGPVRLPFSRSLLPHTHATRPRHDTAH